MTTSEIFLIGLSVLNLIVLILILIKVFSNIQRGVSHIKAGFGDLMRSTADEFQRSRNDNIAFQNIMRESQTALQKQMYDFTNEFTRQISEAQNQFEKMFCKAGRRGKANLRHYADLSKLLSNSREYQRKEHRAERKAGKDGGSRHSQNAGEQRAKARGNENDSGRKLSQTLTTRLDSSFKTVSSSLKMCISPLAR